MDQDVVIHVRAKQARADWLLWFEVTGIEVSPICCVWRAKRSRSILHPRVTLWNRFAAL